MSATFRTLSSLSLIALSALVVTSADGFSLNTVNGERMAPGDGLIVEAKRAKCSAPGAADYEGTDMSGVTPQCEAIFNACIDESVACDVRKRKCRDFDRMDRDGSCYKKRRK